MGNIDWQDQVIEHVKGIINVGNYRIDMMCAGRLHTMMTEMTPEKEKSGNWCTQEEWDKRREEHRIVREYLKKISECIAI